MLKKLLIIFVSFLSIVSVNSVFAKTKCSDPSLLCVGLVTDVGVIDDKSFNQSAHDGLKLATENLGAKIKYIETRDAKDYMNNIGLFAKKGYDVIVTVGFALGDATVKAAKKYPHIKFIGVDQFQPKPVQNVVGLIFKEDFAGFKAGVLAAMLTKSNIIAAVLATDMIPPVVNFKKGYEAGAKYINSNIKIISTFHPGGLDVAFTDPEWGASTAQQAISLGADVVFAAGGLTGNGGLIETASHKGKYCIGVDTDQWHTVPASRPCLVSCALKLISPAVYELIIKAAKDKFPSGNYFGDVGLSPFHDFDKKISPKIKEKLNEVNIKLKNGTIKIN